MIFFFIFSMFQEKGFKETQLVHSRVADAYADKEKIVNRYFTDNHIRQSGFSLFLRGFKEDAKLEAWDKEKGKDQYVLLTTYDICATSGQPGPKRKEGDGQVQEGVYYINHFNPISNFFLSLGINYPNESDRILSDQKHPGGSILHSRELCYDRMYSHHG
jgi:murein L,D-transpeptidase YafK